MALLSDEEFRKKLEAWRTRIHSPAQQIREAQDLLLMELSDTGQFQHALLFMSVVLGRGEIQMTSNTTNIGAAGVAVTGGTSHGTIIGNLQQNINPDVAKVMDGIEQLRQRLVASTELNTDEKEESSLAIEDVRTELQKAPEQRNSSRIRMGVKMLASSVKLVDGAQHLYDSIAPHLANLIHHL